MERCTELTVPVSDGEGRRRPGKTDRKRGEGALNQSGGGSLSLSFVYFCVLNQIDALANM